MAKWRNWQTHQTQNLALFTQRVGSTPTFATIKTAHLYKGRSKGLAWLYAENGGSPGPELI